MSDVDISMARIHCAAAEIAISEMNLAKAKCLSDRGFNYKDQLKVVDAHQEAKKQVWLMVAYLGGPTEVFKKVVGELPNELAEKAEKENPG